MAAITWLPFFFSQTMIRVMVITLQLKRFCFCLLLPVVAACGNQNELNYHPMSVGAEWAYAGTMRLGSGEVVKVQSVGSMVDTEIIQGKRYYKLITTYEGARGTPPQTVSYLRKAAKGIYSIPAEQKDKPELLSTPLPIKNGSTWELATHSPTIKGTYRVVGRETVYLPGGKQYEDCLKIYLQQEKDGVSGERLDYIAPNVGMVKQLVTFGDISLEVNLERYTPGSD
jgi:hypothetical protein